MNTLEEANIEKIKTQYDFDKLFSLLHHEDDTLIMHAAEAVEIITKNNPEYLIGHEHELAELFLNEKSKELHKLIALILPRATIKKADQHAINFKLIYWLKNKDLEQIIRIKALDALFSFLKRKFILSMH